MLSQEPSRVSSVDEKITIGIYGTEKDGWRAALSQVENIKKIYEEFKSAAAHHGKKPPQIVLSALLIPNWENKSSYEDHAYIEQQKQFMADLRKELVRAELGEVVTLEDFYQKAAYPDEKAYLVQLTAKGSNADMIKSHALISLENQKLKHLQLDSNTQILSYQGLYDVTFGDRHQHLTAGVELNASYYDTTYVSAHNKIVYTIPESEFAKQLMLEHLAYCKMHAGDHLSPATADEKRSKNSIYSKAFTKALENLGLVRAASKGPKTVYVADMSQPEYGLTSLIFTAVHQTWKDSSTLQSLGEEGLLLKELEQVSKGLSVRMGDAVCDFASFETALKKQTGLISLHSSPLEMVCDFCNLEKDTGIPTLMEAIGGVGIDLKTRRYDLYGTEQGAHDLLGRISSAEVELDLIRIYFSALEKRIMGDPSFFKGIELLSTVIGYIPNTPRGNEFTKMMFGCSLGELKINPLGLSEKIQEQLHKELLQERFEAGVSGAGKRPEWMQQSSSVQDKKVATATVAVQPIAGDPADEESAEILRARQSPGLE